MGKGIKRKKTQQEKVDKEEEGRPAKSVRNSEELLEKKTPKWINRQRVLVFATRGVSFRDRHLMKDLKSLMPHSKSESKMERQKNLQVVNEICLSKNCSKTILFEGRRKRDLYLWMSNVPDGPSVKFYVENINTMGELKFTGNCLRGSRPLLSFDDKFNDKPHYILLKELLVQIFGVPNRHPKSQPFFDHVYTFSIQDNRIWFRNFQILTEDGALTEIGPRFVLNPVKVFAESFGGETLWENPSYISPGKLRQAVKKKKCVKYENRIQQKVLKEVKTPKTTYDLDPLDEIFQN